MNEINGGRGRKKEKFHTFLTLNLLKVSIKAKKSFFFYTMNLT
jgi:hypothetical protein